MKKILIVAAMLSSLGAYAQGQINFNNTVPAASTPINAPIFDVGGSTKLAGPGFQAQLWGGPNAGALAAVGTSNPFRSGAAAGYFVSGTKTFDPAAANNVAPGATAVLQVRAWEGIAGSVYVDTVKHGKSGDLSIATGGAGSPPSVPADLVGLQSFSLLAAVPEPSTIALGALGLVALFLRRRK